MVGSPGANDASHSPGSDSTRRRKLPLSPMMTSSWQPVPFSTVRGDDQEHETDDNDLGLSSTMPLDERQHHDEVTMRETIWNHIIGKSKALVLGQMLAFWLVRAFFFCHIFANDIFCWRKSCMITHTLSLASNE